MPFTAITKPSVGEPTKKQAFADAVVDDLNFLNDQLTGLRVGQSVVNGSFEDEGATSNIPSGWTWTAQTNGTGVMDSITTAHGDQSFAITSIGGGGGNGGGQLESEDFFEVTPQRALLVKWQHSSTAAGIRNIVSVRWYDASQVFIASSDLYDSTSNPTTWTLQTASATPPATARFAKLRFIGADSSSSTAGSVYLDDVTIEQIGGLTRRVTFDVAGTYAWIAPASVSVARVICIGGGGGGAGGITNNEEGGGGGGAGGYAEKYVPVTPGSGYDVVVGGGGAAGLAYADGSDGIDSSFDTTSVVGGAGIKGLKPISGAGGGTGGAGGSGTGDTVYAGQDGQDGDAPNFFGGHGGFAVNGGGGGKGGLAEAAGTAGVAPGGGGGGGGSLTGANGAAGATGTVMIEY